MPIKHAFVSPKADGADATKVRPSDWNNDHTGTNVHNHADTSTGGTLTPGDVGADAAGSAAAAQSAAEATAAGYVTSHEGAADPHTGYLKESVVSGLGTPALTLGTTNAAGSATTGIATDGTIAAFDATDPTTQAFGDSAVVGAAGVAARRDHKHAMPANPVTGQVVTASFVIDGGGSAITTGIKGDLVIDFACTITGVTLLADQSGSIVVDLWKDTYANFAPTVADTITAAAKPTISTAIKSRDVTLTGWTTSVAAGDIIRFNVDSASTVTRVTVALRLART